MVQPYNYMIGSAQDPTQSFTEGLKIADFLRQRQLQQQQMEREQQRLQDFKKAETEFFGVQGIPTMAQTLRYASYLPKDQAELIIKGRDTQSAEVTKSNLSLAGQVLSSLLSDNKTQAIDLVRQRVVAAKNSGDEPTSQQFDMIAKSLEAAPSSEAAFKNYAPYVSLLGEEGRKMLESVYAAQERPFAQRKVEAEAQTAEEEAKKRRSEAKTAEIAARYAEPQVLLDLEAKGWNLKKIRQEIETSQQQSRLALLQAQLAKEDKELKRQELQAKIDEAKRKQSADLQQKVADVEGARFNIDNMLNTADRILKNPSLNSVIGTIQGRMPVVLSDEAQDAVALIETLGSQAFLSQIPNVKGMGALSNAEGEKLQNAFQNLGRVQSEKQFKENLKEAQRLLLKARQNVSTRYGVPETVPDTPAAKPAEAKSIDEILKELGVSR